MFSNQGYESKIIDTSSQTIANQCDLHKPCGKERFCSENTKLAAPVMSLSLKTACANMRKDEDARKDVKGDADQVVAKVAGGTSQPRQGADSTLLIMVNGQKCNIGRIH